MNRARQRRDQGTDHPRGSRQHGHIEEFVTARREHLEVASFAPGGFQCKRPGCYAGSNARQLPGPPMNDDIGRRVQQTVCADCWTGWLRDYSIKVINELRLDLSTERGQEEYDRYMREYLGLD